MPNRLINETSPYLLQHAHNPVDWYPWDSEALEKARREDRPIFLSIGYAACHWCHVMERESFEDPETAAYLNENFVPIKVDREERPDLDGIYMTAVVSITGQGGWPMSLFLTPDGRPFFGGTYFPSERRFGMPSFKEVLASVAQVWQQDREQVFKIAQNLTDHLKQDKYPSGGNPADLDLNFIRKAVRNLAGSYDRVHGGWGQAPKFPMPMALEFLLLQASRGNQDALQIGLHDLKLMSRGGMYDVVGGGFHRYSTDNFWRVPHFEKMLYDNAQLARVYLHAYLIIRDNSLKQVCEETLDFILAEMIDPAGGFYSSQDADSEGEEGKFYLWSPEEIRAALPDPSEAEFILTTYRVTKGGNFEGKTILQKPSDDEELAARFNITAKEFRTRLTHAHHLLYQARSTRVHPLMDDKVLVFWNGLALQAFAEAGRFLNNSRYLMAAEKNAHFLLSELRSQGRLLRSWRAGKVHHNAFLEDYAALILGLLALYQADFKPEWFIAAKELANDMLAQFRDPRGGFYDTRHDHDQLIVRPKDLQDNAVPSGNAQAALALIQLAAFEHNPTWQDTAEAMLAGAQDMAANYPSAFSFWLHALDFAAGPVQQIALIWPAGESEPTSWIDHLSRTYSPRTLIAAAPDSTGTLPVPELLQDRPAVKNQTTVYICQNFSCKLPLTDFGEFEAAFTPSTA